MQSAKGILDLDPRTKIILLICVNIFVFTNSRLGAEILIISFVVCLLLLCGVYKVAGKILCLYGALLAMQYWVLPHSPQILLNSLNILVITFRKLLPCVALGSLLIQTTPIRLLIQALQKWHLPQSVIIPLTITVRYFPTLRQEYQSIRDAMKLRSIHGPIQKLEFIFVPLILSASSAADELSQAITARGIDNPGKKSYYTTLRFRTADYLLCILSGLLIPLTWLL